VSDALQQLLADLVAIDSINPDLVPGGAGELEVMRFAAGWLERAGLDVELVEAAPGRPNVVAVARGRGGGRTLLLNGHLDTVGVEGMQRPFQPHVEAGRLHGRGSFDMKAGVAAMLWAGAEAARLDLRGDVVVAAVCDEEYASIGSDALVRDVRADAAIITEPTGLDVCIAHKGFVWLEIETAGVAAHGSRRDLGVDAIAKMGRILVGLEQLDGALAQGPSHRLLGTGSLHASLIAGGQELSSYPERCTLSVERRTVPGETAATVEAELQAVLDAAAASDPALEATRRTVFDRDPFEVGEDEPIVRLVRRHAAAVLGREPALCSDPAWMEAAILARAGIPTVVFGPAGEGAHAVVEWADLASTRACAETLLGVAREFCA
jgi:acetylornithine deacetylase